MTKTIEEAQAIRPATARPVVTAQNMLYAQGYKPTAAELATLVAWADYLEALVDSREVSIAVRDFDGARIGYLTFTQL